MCSTLVELLSPTLNRKLIEQALGRSRIVRALTHAV
jgi:hypothetical protein